MNGYNSKEFGFQIIDPHHKTKQKKEKNHKNTRKKNNFQKKKKKGKGTKKKKDVTIPCFCMTNYLCKLLAKN